MKIISFESLSQISDVFLESIKLYVRNLRQSYIYIAIVIIDLGIMSNDASMELETIRELKQKLHQSFLQMSDIQKIYEGELQQQQEQCESRIEELERQNKRLIDRLRQFQNYGQPAHKFFLDGLEETNLEIELDKICNSFTEENSFAELLKRGSFSSHSEQLSQLEIIIRSGIESVSADLLQYFRVSKKVTAQNNNLRDELYSANENIKVENRKFEDASRLSQELFNTVAKLKEDNKKLAEIYRQQLERNQKAPEKVDQTRNKSWKDFLVVNCQTVKPNHASESNPNQTEFKHFMRKHASCNQYKP